MNVLIGMLVGGYDVSTLILMFRINAMMNLFGLMMELHNQTMPKTDWTACIYGCIAGIIPGIVIALYVGGAAQSVNTEIPGFVYAIIVTLFIFFNIFAVNMWLQYRGIDPWKDYLFGERMYNHVKPCGEIAIGLANQGRSTATELKHRTIQIVTPAQAVMFL
jgi:hypothetical protein